MTHPALRQCEHQLMTYRRVWPTSVVAAVLSPVLFLAAIGVGLGQSVDRGPAASSLGGVRYLAFLAPGLLAATAMQVGAGESLWSVHAGFEWKRFFHAAAATPLRPFDILLGWLTWIAVRLLLGAVLFLVAAAAFGAVRSPQALLAVPAAVLTGLAFAAPLTAFAATRTREHSFALVVRLGIVPLFLFSGAFFPLGQLPAAVRPVAWATPLWHGVEVCRSLMLGSVEVGPVLLHVAVLAGFAAGGLAWGARTFTRRLAP